MASRNHDPRSVLLVDSCHTESPKIEAPRRFGFYWTEGVRGLGWAVESVPTLKGGSTIGIPSPPAIWDVESGVVGTPSLRDAERLQGFPSGWTEAAATDTGLRDSFRWKLVGNAVNVRLSEWLGKRFLEPLDYDDSADFPLGPAEPWPSAAWGAEGIAHRAEVSERVRTRRKQLLLSDFLLDDLKPLSSRAARGFLDRTSQGSLRFPAGFLDAVRAHEARMNDLGVGA